ncbi:VOC family protein [Leptospira sp. 'Mane']|uniref:VOC family protein n=1 Tax=Leptospira sp. 'Mane' TaxID=3387407 RepID=UPI00398BBC7C
MIHHIAIGTQSVQVLSNFYKKIPNCIFLKENLCPNSEEVRSVWFQISKTILMIEDGNKEAARALVFQCNEEDRANWKTFLNSVSVSERTEFTIYFSDPDGNKLGISSFPTPLNL